MTKSIMPNLIILCGIPGSGKTTYAKKYIMANLNTRHISSDAIREELYGNEETQGNPREVFELMQKRAIEALNNGVNVIYDCTSMTRKDRKELISKCPDFVNIVCYIIWASIETCIKRDSKRERTVGEEIIKKSISRFQPPFYDEGINEIRVEICDDINIENYKKNCRNEMLISQENHHHTKNVIEHCNIAVEYAINNDFPVDVQYAALIHDIGKPKTKTFKNMKGEVGVEAHYYQHQNYGAWMSYGFVPNMSIDPVTVAWLIGAQMDVFLNTKYYNHLPFFLKNKVDQLHECDINAK